MLVDIYALRFQELFFGIQAPLCQMITIEKLGPVEKQGRSERYRRKCCVAGLVIDNVNLDKECKIKASNNDECILEELRGQLLFGDLRAVL